LSAKILNLVDKDELSIDDIIVNQLVALEKNLDKTKEHYLFEILDLLVRYVELYEYDRDLEQAHAGLIYTYIQLEKWEGDEPWSGE